MQLDPTYIPTPAINDRLSSSFCHSTSVEPAYEPSSFNYFSVLLPFLSFYQLLENEKILLVLATRDKFIVHLERLPVLDAAIQRNKPIKIVSRDKLGRDVLFSFDETKRTLVVCASTKVPHRDRCLTVFI